MKIEDLTLEEAKKIVDNAMDGATHVLLIEEGNCRYLNEDKVMVGRQPPVGNRCHKYNIYSLVDVQLHINRIKIVESPESPKHEEETFAPPEDKAMRFNTGKPELSYLLDAPVAVKGLCEVFAMGAEKYERDNWQKGLDKNQIIDSLLRHLLAFKSGELIDPESQKSHTFHVLWNSLVLAEQHSGE